MAVHIVVDEGNSLTKLALFRGDALFHQEVFEGDRWRSFEPTRYTEERYHVLVCSVRSAAPGLPGWVHPDGTSLVLNHRLPMPFEMGYGTPETLGGDRLANAAGAVREYGRTCLVVDAGSCLTLTTVEEGVLTGGSISPGVRMRFRALHRFTGALPFPEEPWETAEFPGRNTRESILSGVLEGIADEAEQKIIRWRTLFPGAPAVITGGDALLLASLLKSPIFADPLLTLKGLNEILARALEHTD
jgi:type III pantothenate kinase